MAGSDPSRGQPARDELLGRLRSEAILWATPEQPILHRDGRAAPWAFYSWNVTQTGTGLRLAAEAMLDRLATFRSTQLAGYGLTAGPLLSACVLLGAGRYTGLSIRTQAKAYLSCRQIEGPGDRTRPVVIVDDSLSSGTSLEAAIVALEDDGFVVEGAVVLVGFPHRGGLEWATDRGYRVDCLFDIWRDIRPAPTPGRPDPPTLPVSPDGTLLPDGEHPAVTARRVAELYLTTGVIPRPPARLNAHYDARGGTFVSFRDRETDHRVGRDGFWRWDPEGSDPARDVLLATLETVQANPEAITADTLGRLKIAVTFFGPLTEIEPAELDFDRFGIVVQSRVFPHKVGGALPNTQVFTSEVAQYAHARDYNAGLDPGEDHVLYRHEVRKYAEPEVEWPLFGQADDAHELDWTRDPELGTALCLRARETLRPATGGPSGVGLADHATPKGVTAVAVGLYDSGLRGWGLAWAPGTLDTLVARAANAAGVEARVDPRPLDLVVSVLHHPEELGAGPAELVAIKARQGLDAVVATSGHVRSAVLPAAVVYNDWTCQDQVAVAASRLGGTAGQVSWSIHQVASWRSAGAGAKPVRSGYVERAPAPLEDRDASLYTEMLAGYVMRSIGADGLPAYAANPVTGEVTRWGSAARVVHALGALHRAGVALERPAWRDAARTGLRTALGHVGVGGSLGWAGGVAGPLADAVLLAALADAGGPELASQAGRALADQVLRLVRPDGLIADGPAQLRVPRDHQFLPGAVLKAVAAWTKAEGANPPSGWLDRQLDLYRRHFRVVRAWGSAGWLPQGWAAVHELTGDPEQSDFVFEVTDWAVARQLTKSGAFLEDLSPREPSFNTGFIAEGVAAAWVAARRAGDREREDRYERAWRAALGFVSTLVIHPEDAFCLPSPEQSVGGVRVTPSGSHVRIDMVSHALNALASGLAALRQVGQIA